MSLETTVWPARKIITRHLSQSEASAVAVRDVRIRGVGTIDELKEWGRATVDRGFAGLVITPVLCAARMRHHLGYDDGRGDQGCPCDPAGKLQEGSAMGLTLRFSEIIFSSMQNETVLKKLGAIARNVGCTTVTGLDSWSLDQPAIVDLWR